MHVWPKYLLQWFWQVKRDLPWRKTNNPYAIWVSEIMLQQTQVKTVIPYYQTFLERFPTVQSLAQAELEEVLEMWRGLGYYSRAQHLWEGARFVLEDWEGKLPASYDSLLKIPGVGEYTAGAIASIAFQERVPAIDGNVNRVLARLLAWEEPPGKVKSRRAFREVLGKCQPDDHPGDFNQALMELGATLCTPKFVNCAECPLTEECAAHKLGQELAFPVKQGQHRVTEALRLTLLIKKEDNFLIKKRPAQGLLANLWEFPGEEIFLQNVESLKEKIWSEAVAESKEGLSRVVLNREVWYELYRRVVPDRSQDQEVWRKLEQSLEVMGPIGHVFSHRRWEMYWIVLECSGELMAKDRRNQDMRWVSREELERIALPVAFQKLLEPSEVENRINKRNT